MAIPRTDEVRHAGRDFYPTTEETKWVSNWEEFAEAGGQFCYDECQTQIELSLPAPYKFSIQFGRNVKGHD